MSQDQIDWCPEAQRIQSARSVRYASYSIWAGGSVTLIRNSVWAVAVPAFFVLVSGLVPARLDHAAEHLLADLRSLAAGRRALSKAFAERQGTYLAGLERRVRWQSEESGGD